MPYWTEKDNTSNISTVQMLLDDVMITIGYIEKPYNNLEYYFAKGWNHEELANNGHWYFKSFEEAEQRIIKHYENERRVLKK